MTREKDWSNGNWWRLFSNHSNTVSNIYMHEIYSIASQAGITVIVLNLTKRDKIILPFSVRKYL